MLAIYRFTEIYLFNIFFFNIYIIEIYILYILQCSNASVYPTLSESLAVHLCMAYLAENFYDF